MASQPSRLPPGARPKTTSENSSRQRPHSQSRHAYEFSGGASSSKPRGPSSGNNRNKPQEKAWHEGGIPSTPGGSNQRQSNKGNQQSGNKPNGDQGGSHRGGNVKARGFDSRGARSGRGRGRGRGGERSMSRGPDRGRSGKGRQTLAVPRLREYLEKDPTEIVMELATDKSGWKEYLNQNDMSTEIVVLVLEIMAKACLCKSSPKNLNSFLAVVWQSGFLTKHLAQFVISLSSVGNIPEDLQPVHHLMKLLYTLLQCLQSSSSEVIVVAVLLEKVFKDNDKIPDDIKVQIVQFKGICEQLEQDRSKLNDRAMLRSQYKAPPDDYRGIQIIPDIQELGKIRRPFLRHNLKKGEYKDVDDYLDVQFRLLREDFVAPLREGVVEYLDNQEDFENNPRRRLQDVRLYYGVGIIRPILTRDGTGHLIEFDTSPFQRVRWESSKRLINGSLLCLTEDKFKSVIFATVEGRDIRQLQRGRIEVKFINLPDIVGKPADATFLMAETSAYYESYRHVLEGLQEYNKDNLPMTSYIVDASSESKPPMYFDHSEPRYDLRPIARKETQHEDENDEDGDEEQPTVDQDILRRLQASLRSVKVLQPGTWPEAETLNFDESQLEAFRAALTNEFVLIQGPPGTGKTYVGLEIVKTLLFNCHAWCHDDTQDEDEWDFRPILIVCYTNHALDQFLEGILEYESGIVRIGGRCKSERLQDCNITNIRKKRKDERQVPDHIHRRRADMQEFYDMRNILTAAHERIALAQTGVLRAATLYDRQLITLMHYRSLISRCQNGPEPMNLWLGLDGKGLSKPPTSRKRQQDTVGQDGNAEDAVDEEEEDSDDEFIHIMEEAELLAEQRQLGTDPTFVKHREESLVKLVSEFVFVPGRRNNAESDAAKRDRRKFEKAIEFAVSNSDMMTPEEADQIRDVWQLPYQQRWRLYRLWVAGYIEIQEQVMVRYQTAYEALSQQRKEIDREEDYLILKDAKVIGLTTTGAAKHRQLLQRVRPKIIVVEEAAEVLEAHIITTLSSDCKHLILIGDHQQLRPNPTVYRLAKQFNLDVSLFERMINNGLPCYRLGLQHRMRPEISVLMKKHFYNGLEDHSSVVHYDSVMGVKNKYVLS